MMIAIFSTDPLTGKEYFHGFQELEMNQKVCGIYAKFLGGFFKERFWVRNYVPYQYNYFTLGQAYEAFLKDQKLMK